MKLLFVTSSFARNDDDPSAAAGLGVYQLVKELSHHISGTVVTPAQAGAPAEEMLGGFKILRVSPERPAAALHQLSGPSHIVRAFRVDRALKRAAKSLEGTHDIAHGHWAFPGGSAVTRLSIPSVVVCLGTDVHRYSRLPYFKTEFRRVVRDATANISMDPRARARIEEVSGREVHYIPNAIPFEDIEVVSGPPGGKRIVWVGRMSPEKGPDVMVRAFKVAHDADPELRLTMIGDGPEFGATAALARELGVDGAIDMTGGVPNQGVLEAYRGAHVVVVSSRSEGLPASALEALASGIPLVSTDVGGLAQLLSRGGGLVAPSEDHVKLGEAINLATARPWDPAFLRSQVAHTALSAVAGSYLQIYSDALARKPRLREVGA